MFEEDQDQWEDTRSTPNPPAQAAASNQDQWDDTRGSTPPPAASAHPNEQVTSTIRFPTWQDVKGAANQASLQDVGDVISRGSEVATGPAHDVLNLVAGNQGQREQAKENLRNLGTGLLNEPVRVVQEANQSGNALIDFGKHLWHGQPVGADIKNAIYHGVGAIPLVGAPLQNIGKELTTSGQVKEGLGDALGLATAFYHPETTPGKGPLVAAPKIGINMGRSPEALEAQKYIMRKGAPANAAAATGSPYVKTLQKGVETTPLAAITSEASHAKAGEVIARVGDELRERNAGAAMVPETAGASTQAALQSKIGAAHDTANVEYSEFRRIAQEPENVKNVQVGTEKINTGLVDHNGNAIIHEQPIIEKISLPAGIGHLAEQLRPLYEETKQWMPVARRQLSPGFTILENIVNSGKDFISAPQAESLLGAVKELAREAPEGRGQGLAKFIVPQLEEVVRTAVDVPLDITALKANLQPIAQDLQQRLAPDQLQALPGYQSMQAILGGGDKLRASQVRSAIGDIGKMANQDQRLTGVLQQAAQDVMAKDPAGALERGRAATKAKYATKDVLDQLRTEPVQAFNQLTYAKDAGIEFLRQINQEVPGESRKIGSAYLGKLFDEKPDKMFASWGNLGPSTKKILFDPAIVPEIDMLVRAARDNAHNPNPSGTATVIGATSSTGGLFLHPIAGGGLILGGYGLSKLLRSPLGVRLLTEGLTVPIHTPRARMIVNTLRRLGAFETSTNQQEQVQPQQNVLGHARGGPIRYDDGGDVDNGDDANDDPVLRDIMRRRMLGQDVSIAPDRRVVAAFDKAPAIPLDQPALNTQINVPRDTSFSDTMSQAKVGPQWMQGDNQPFLNIPTVGGSPMNMADIVRLPESKLEAGLTLAGALIPGAKVLQGAKGAVRAGTTMLEGAAPEAGLLSNAINEAGEVPSNLVTKAPAVLKGLTPQAVLREIKRKIPQRESYGAYAQENPTAGAELLPGIENAQPAMSGRPMLPRKMPKKVSPRVADALQNPEVERQLHQWVQEGGEKMPEDWYRTSPLFQRYIQEWGSPEAAAGPYEQFWQSFAAASPRNPVPTNARAGSYYNYLLSQGLKIPNKPVKGYGNIAQRLHVQNARRIQDFGSLDPLKNPKPASFVENLLGNEMPVTSDTHNFRALGMAAKDPRFLATSVESSEGQKVAEALKKFNPKAAYDAGELTMEQALDKPSYWVAAPSAATEYGPYEAWQQRQAASIGLTPSNWQGKMWVGAGPTTGLSSPGEIVLRTLARRVAYTADRMGVPREVVLRKLIRGEIPLLGVGAGAVGLGALSQQDQGSTPQAGLGSMR